jgi:hypothetical protein
MSDLLLLAGVVLLLAGAFAIAMVLGLVLLGLVLVGLSVAFVDGK